MTTKTFSSLPSIDTTALAAVTGGYHDQASGPVYTPPCRGGVLAGVLGLCHGGLASELGSPQP